MKKKLLAVLFGAVLVLGACGGGDSNGDSNKDGNDNGNNNAATNVSSGEEIYKNKCAGCHGEDLGGIAGPALTEIGSKYSAADLADIIENGIGGMRPVNMSDEDREALSEWLASKK